LARRRRLVKLRSSKNENAKTHGSRIECWVGGQPPQGRSLGRDWKNRKRQWTIYLGKKPKSERTGLILLTGREATSPFSRKKKELGLPIPDFQGGGSLRTGKNPRFCQRRTSRKRTENEYPSTSAGCVRLRKKSIPNWSSRVAR